jgi:hypothetical protein
VSWQQYYIHYLATFLLRISSYHNPLILHTSSLQTTSTLPIRFKKEWLSHNDFLQLLQGWWISFILLYIFANQWRLKKYNLLGKI